MKGYFCLKGGPYPAAGSLLHYADGQWCLSGGKGRRYDHVTFRRGLNGTVFRQFARDLERLLMQQQFWRPRTSLSAADLMPRWDLDTPDSPRSQP